MRSRTTSRRSSRDPRASLGLEPEDSDLGHEKGRMAMKYYAGIGSRSTPPQVLERMETLARALAKNGWWLRSGHAPAADQAFERGAGGQAEIFMPWKSFEDGVPVSGKWYDRPTKEAIALAGKFHPNWVWLTQSVRLLMARNSHQVLGYDLQTPVTFVVCWTPQGSGGGGTGQALRIARHHDIPIYDLANHGDANRIERYLSDGQVA